MRKLVFLLLLIGILIGIISTGVVQQALWSSSETQGQTETDLVPGDVAEDVGGDASDQQDDSEVVEPLEPVELTLWSYYEEDWNEAIAAFGKKYPHVSIKLVTFPYNTYADTYFRALVEGTVPDLMVIDSEHFGRFTDIEGLTDLYQDSYGIDKYEKYFSESLWRMGQSVNQERMLGVPFITSPYLTFYRADIMEEYGFPSDPDELGTFMEDPENWLAIGNALKDDNKYIVQWTTEILRIYDFGSGFFNEDYEFLRNNKETREAIRVAKTAHQQGLVPNNDIWSPTGQKAIRDDQMVMLYLGTWGAHQIETWAPEQAGLWRATRLPFNVYGWSNSTILSIPAESPNQEMAWEFLKYYSFERVLNGNYGTVPGFLPARNNQSTIHQKWDYLGGQKFQKLIESILADTEEPFLTPLDEEAANIWWGNITQGIEWVEADEILEKIDNDIQSELGRDIEILRKSRK